MSEILDFDPIALREKYRHERDRRLRPDGNEQYVEVAADSAGGSKRTRLRSSSASAVNYSLSTTTILPKHGWERRHSGARTSFVRLSTPRKGCHPSSKRKTSSGQL